MVTSLATPVAVTCKQRTVSGAHSTQQQVRGPSAVCVSVCALSGRSSGDVAHEAEVLILQARLALLAQHNEDAVKLSQVF